ncbi:MAG TPA: hypothetical protein DHV28_06490 [Ignavibacteriales bacterium]|nr:hypothetical protein [Ignavibacteriales bacterium]
MIRILVTFFVIIILILFYGCENKTEKIKPGLNEEFNFNFSEYENIFKKNIVIPDTQSSLFETCGKDLDTIKYYYSTQNYKPIFLKSFESKSFVDSLLEILGAAADHGLNPESYHYTQIKNEFDEVLNPKTDSNKRYFYLANTELIAAHAILIYSTHMRHGVVNPRQLYFDRYYLPVTDSLNKKLFEPFQQKNVIHYLQNIQPKSKKYTRLQTALKRFEAISSIEWIKIPVSDKKIEIGNESASIRNIVDKLVVLGFLDTNKVKLKELDRYDSLLVEPIKEFQRANGLNDDGVIGKTTIERLNISPKQYVEKIKLNLERFRWIDYSDTARYVMVNIPDFKLYVMENENEKFNIKVCTGRKGKWETPNLYGRISYLVLNPTWSVPKSIIQEEIVSGLRKDSLYLKKRNFKVFKSGERVSLDGLTAHDLASSNRYSLVQDPGLGNALGKIKFMFQNPFGVYLHDTPTRAPFGYVNRAVSHGCVRVEKPIELADYFLSNNSRWTTDFLKIEIGQKVNDPKIISEFNSLRYELRKNNSYGVTTEVKFDKKIPVFIDYYTTWVDADGRFNYRDDVYNRDKILEQNLFSNK